MLTHGFIFNGILRNYGIAGRFESLKRERALLFAKAKSSKNFLDSALQNRGWILGFCKILRVWILDSAEL